MKRLYLENEARKLENFERSRCPSVDVNLTVSPLDGEGLREIAPGVCVRVVDNGVDVGFFRPTAAPRNGRRGLVFAGGMDWYPNREAMLFFAQKIWPALVEDDPRRTVTIVGREPPPQVLAASRDSRVTVTGFVDDVRPYLDRAAIYVCPIRDGGGTRLKILDALAMAKPLVATALAVEGLDLQEGTHYLRAEKPAEFVEKIRRLERDGGLRDRLARAGRQLVESRFSWDAIGSKLEAAYRLMKHYEDSRHRASAIRNQLPSLLEQVFPELNAQWKKLDGKTALLFLAKNPTPASILKLGRKRF